MESQPPQTLKTELVHLDHNLKQIERTHHAGIQRAPGSLPVLEAFQEFLETERRKAKRKMLALTALFSVLLIAAASGGTAAVIWQMKRNAVDYDAVSQKTATLETQLAENRKAIHASLADLDTRVEEDAQKLKTRQTSLQTAQADMTERIAARDKDLNALQEKLDHLASENALLKKDLTRVMQTWPSLTQRVEALTPLLSAKPAQKRVESKSGATSKTTPMQATDTSPSIVASSAAAPASALTLKITPPGDAVGIRWRLPLIQE